MHLWNDYEGKTLAGTFLIESLLFTEGRHACFATHDRSGRPAVLRLTEALNDQQAMRARYGAIQAVGQPNLVSIEDFGDVEVEGTPLIYLVMESTDENLAEIVRERPLAIEETGEVALSLVAALEALHAHGLVHGHVEPASVLAAGQVIKLRSDCVRPAPEGEDGDRARADDVFGLADVLNRCLTQRRLEDASDALALPEPYASIVRNVVRGSWGLEQVAQELRRSVRASAPQPVGAEPVRGGAAMPSGASSVPEGPSVASGEVASGEGAGRASSADPQLSLPYVSPGAPLADEAHAGGDEVERHASLRAGRPIAWIILGVAAVCLLLVWHVAGNRHKGGIVVRDTAETPAVPALKERAALPASPPIVAAPPVAAGEHPAPASLRREVWRVVAYTYNLEAQAQSKAHTIAERHAELHPEVFSPTGHAPFLVTLGGSLTQQQAASMRERARSEGLARDVYMQNYAR